MKKIVIFICTLISSLVLVGCETPINYRVAVDFYPMPEILNLIKDDLAADGLFIEIVNINYNSANLPLKNGEVDGNMVQHQYFMQNFNTTQNADLVIAQPIYHSKFALYSETYDSIDDIVDGETIYLPEDVVNLPRALMLLASTGLIQLAEGKTVTATLADVVSNPKGLIFNLKGLTTTPGAYKDAGRKLAIMYPSYARAMIGLEGTDEVLVAETMNALTETYAISFVTRQDNLDAALTQLFITHLTSQKVKDWINENYGWAAIPAF